LRNEVSQEKINKIILKRKSDKKVRILFLSNMIKTKGWPIILSAAKILKEKGLNFDISFVGAWPSSLEKNEFNSIVKKNSLQRDVKYLGPKKGIQKEEILKESDIFVFPTDYELETFGLVITEAMMYSLPVIANGVATIPSIIENKKTGFVLKENTSKEVAKYLEILINDKDKRINMGIEGRKRFLKKFEMKDYEKKIVKILLSEYQ